MSLHLEYLKTFIEIDDKHLWGYELRLVNNDLYCAKLLVIDQPLAMSSLHYHNVKDETFMVLSGEVEAEYGYTGRMRLKAGGRLRIPSGLQHRFWVEGGTATILEVSTHHDDKDTYRIELSRYVGRPSK